MSKIIIAGQHLTEMGPKYKTWFDTGWDATIEGQVSPTGIVTPGVGAFGVDAKNKGLRRYAFRKELRRYNKTPPLDAAKALIRKFVLHHDGVGSSAICWNVLQNERGLSVHFLIDNDGTIYQTLDLAFMGFHAAKYNVDSIGVEICNRGVLEPPDFYVGKPDPHPLAPPYKINGHPITSFDFTEKQYDAFFALAQALVKLLPNLALEYPRDAMLPTKPAWGCLGPVDALGDSFPASSFSGFMGHYHLTTRKWDPGPFDFKKWIDKLRGQRVFPLAVPGATLDASSGKPIVPEDPAQLPTAIQPYYDDNEQLAAGGFFPVGPWGVSRLWHGGVHLPATPGDPVYAPFPGRVIAARTKGVTDIGSSNFVLLRHDLNVAGEQIRVYSLFMHLDEAGAKERPGWMDTEAVALDPEALVDQYDAVVDSGGLIGHVGTVGPGDLNKAQVHFEIFSDKRWFQTEGSPWKLVDGSSTGHFCEDDEINNLIDTDKDGRLSRTELTDFYANGDKALLRDYITLHVSEWAPDPDLLAELSRSLTDFQKKTPKRKGKAANADNDDEDIAIQAMIEEQIAPFVWWTDPVAKALKLPNSAIVYHYHPIRFMEYVNSAFKANDVKGTEKPIDDNDDTKGEFAAAPTDIVEAPDDYLKLENLVDGWAGDPAPT